MQQCAKDALYPMSGMKGSVEKLTRIYAKAGIAERFRGTFHDVPHSFTPAMPEEAFAWIEKWTAGPNYSTYCRHGGRVAGIQEVRVMRYLLSTSTVILATVAQIAAAQTAPTPAENARQPLYRVTIVSRTTKALNYGHLTTPTRIGFAGTPLASDARGEATIEPGRGATEIRARFSEVPPPQRFGTQYLTYVVWAISPDGRAQNLGELMLDASNKGRLNTSTAMQTFALVVTAEPYYSVTQPSDVVVMENVIIPGTVGKVQEVNATYELLPRKPFTWESGRQAPASAKLVSTDEYNAMTALYQAQNAIQIAEAQNAQRYAPERLARARQLFEQARAYPVSLHKEIVAVAREAAQVAEDGRLIAVKRAEAERVAAERAAAEAEQRATEARRRAESERAALEAESQRSRMETAPRPQQQAAPVAPAPAAAESSKPPIEVDPGQFTHGTSRATENRGRVLAALRPLFQTTDTARGIVLTLSEAAAANPSLATPLTRLAQAVRDHRDLHIEVEGHSDRGDDTGGTQRRAEMVRNALIAAGVPASIITARGYGNTRPVTSNASPAGRTANRRIEIVIAGDAIGSVPTWGRTYSLLPATRR